MSLFQRIFLSFGLAALLIAASFFAIGRYHGGEVIQQTQQILTAQAEVVATLWQEGGRRATMRWLHRQGNQQGNQQRPLLLDKNGMSPLPRHAARQPWLHGPISAGIQRLKFGKVAVVVALPEISPPLYLVQPIELGRLHRLPLVGWLIIALSIIGVVSLLLALALSKRIRYLRHAAQIMAKGDLSARVELSGRDEVSALAKDFNPMAERLNEIMVSQKQLVSDVSHELRSPLARLRIALELAERADDPSAVLKRISKEADELEALVTDLLSLARIEAGTTQQEAQEVALCELVNRIATDANYEGEQSQRRVNLVTCEPSAIAGDAILLKAAIENVVRNAIRHTPDKSSVEISVIRNQTQIEIIIEDQGPGVPEEQLLRIFEPFARIAEARDRSSGGYGLGLAITGRIMNAHGGSGRAENRPAGGLRVILTLPVS
jgi:signal transduction histidine kinase